MKKSELRAIIREEIQHIMEAKWPGKPICPQCGRRIEKFAKDAKEAIKMCPKCKGVYKDEALKPRTSKEWEKTRQRTNQWKKEQPYNGLRNDPVFKKSQTKKVTDAYSPEQLKSLRGFDPKGFTQKLKKDYKCQECGKMMTAKAAEKAMYSDRGCPGCGGSDIDLA